MNWTKVVERLRSDRAQFQRIATTPNVPENLRSAAAISQAVVGSLADALEQGLPSERRPRKSALQKHEQ